MEIKTKHNGEKLINLSPAPHMEESNKRDQIVSLVRRWAGSASAAVLDPTTEIFTIPEVEGLVGYRIESKCAIVFGDPVCAPVNIPRLISAFHQFCDSKGLSIIYIIATETFARWSINNTCKTLIEFGEELTINASVDPRTNEGVRGSLVRRKTKHALNDGVTVEEYVNQDPKLEEAIEGVGDKWLRARIGPQVYISHIQLFTDHAGKRWFYAKHKNQIVGVVLLNQLQSHNGWLMNHVMHTPDAPHGTPELLVVTALEAVRKEGCNYVTFGSVSGVNLGEVIGMGTLSEAITRLSFRVITKILRLGGRRKFWEKFEPESHKSFLLFSKPKIGIREGRALMRALNVSF